MLHAVLFLRRLEGEAGPVRRPGPGGIRPFLPGHGRQACVKWVWATWRSRAKMRRIGEAFYGRQPAYRAALATPGEQSLAAAAGAQCVCRRGGTPERADGLPTYVREAERRLADARGGKPAAGELDFPDPATCPGRDPIGEAIDDATRLERSSERPWSVPVAAQRGAGDRTACRARCRRSDERRAIAGACRSARSAAPRGRTSMLTRHGHDGLHVVGHVSATVGQTCVVTLEPIENEIDEAVDLIFVPAGRDVAREREIAEAAIVADDAAGSSLVAAWSTSARSRPSSCCSGSIPIRASPVPCFDAPADRRRHGASVRGTCRAEEERRDRPWHRSGRL